MINMEHGKIILSRWLDDNYEINTDLLEAKKWIALPIADVLNPMEAEWLSEAINNINIERLIGLAFEYEKEPSIALVNIDRNSILKFNYDNMSKYVMLTSIDEKFFYFKEQENRYFLLCGKESFVKHAYKCSLETAKLMYFDYWVNDDYNTKEEKRFLTHIWHKYFKK